MDAPALIPPFRFSSVQDCLYRGSYPTLKNFRFLRRLGLRTIISVIPESPTCDLLEFCIYEKIQNYHFYAEKFTSDNVTVSPNIVAQIIQLLIDPERAPIYLHCLDGANVTGIIIMTLRKLQNWTKSAIISEFCRFTRDHCIEKDESEYLAAFSEEITIPSDVPEWLWNGIRILKHPTMIIHQPDLEQSLPNANTMNPASGISNVKWDLEVNEPFLRQLEESNRLRPFSITADIVEDGDQEFIDEAILEIPIPRALEALDLAGV